ncbi:MAG: hypothetical protein AAB456_00235 [Patescibacteria group bacterium]
MKKFIRQIYKFEFKLDNDREYNLLVEAQDYQTAREYLANDLKEIIGGGV